MHSVVPVGCLCLGQDHREPHMTRELSGWRPGFRRPLRKTAPRQSESSDTREVQMTIRNSASTKAALVLISIVAAIVGLNRTVFAVRASGQDQTRLMLVDASQSETGSPTDPAAILASARVIYVCSRTGFVKSEVIENELLKRAEFQQTGMVITKDPGAADLVMEVRRSNFTTEYPYVVVNPRTRLVVASGKVNSLFGTAASKIAKGFIKQLQKARTPAGAKSKK